MEAGSIQWSVPESAGVQQQTVPECSQRLPDSTTHPDSATLWHGVAQSAGHCRECSQRPPETAGSSSILYQMLAYSSILSRPLPEAAGVQKCSDKNTTPYIIKGINCNRWTNASCV